MTTKKLKQLIDIMNVHCISSQYCSIAANDGDSEFLAYWNSDGFYFGGYENGFEVEFTQDQEDMLKDLIVNELNEILTYENY